MLFEFSALQTDKGILTKQFNLDQFGKLIKINGINFSNGRIKKLSIENLETFKFFYENTDPNECFMYQIPINQDAKYVTTLAQYPYLDKSKMENTITRTSYNFKWPDNFIFFGDYDYNTDHNESPLDNYELDAKIRRYLELPHDLKILYTNSASSFINKDGIYLKSLGSRHFYFLVKSNNGSDAINFFINKIKSIDDLDCYFMKKTKIREYKEFKYFDLMSLSNARIDFVANPILLSNRLSIDKNKINKILGSSDYLDFKSYKTDGNNMLQLKTKSKKIYINNTSTRVSNTNLRNEVLSFDQEIKFESGETRLVREIINNNEFPINQPQKIYCLEDNKSDKTLLTKYENHIGIHGFCNGGYLYQIYFDKTNSIELSFDKYIDPTQLRLDKKNYFIFAPTGSGKTNFIQDYSKTNKCVFLAPTVAIVKQQNPDLFFRIYEGINYKHIQKNQNRSFACTFSSFYKLIDSGLDFSDYTLFLDEAHVLNESIHVNSVQRIIENLNKFNNYVLLSGSHFNSTIHEIDYKNNRNIHTININITNQPVQKNLIIYKKNHTKRETSELFRQLVWEISVSRKDKNTLNFIIYNETGVKLDGFINLLNQYIPESTLDNLIYENHALDEITPINSNLKESNIFQEILKNQMIPDNIRTIISTSVIREGVNINNTFENVNVFVFSNNFDAGDINQFCSRFRKSKNINLFYDVSNDINWGDQQNLFEKVKKEITQKYNDIADTINSSIKFKNVFAEINPFLLENIFDIINSEYTINKLKLNSMILSEYKKREFLFGLSKSILINKYNFVYSTQNDIYCPEFIREDKTEKTKITIFADEQKEKIKTTISNLFHFKKNKTNPRSFYDWLMTVDFDELNYLDKNDFIYFYDKIEYDERFETLSINKFKSVILNHHYHNNSDNEVFLSKLLEISGDLEKKQQKIRNKDIRDIIINVCSYYNINLYTFFNYTEDGNLSKFPKFQIFRDSIFIKTDFFHNSPLSYSDKLFTVVNNASKLL